MLTVIDTQYYDVLSTGVPTPVCMKIQLISVINQIVVVKRGVTDYYRPAC